MYSHVPGELYPRRQRTPSDDEVDALVVELRERHPNTPRVNRAFIYDLAIGEDSALADYADAASLAYVWAGKALLEERGLMTRYWSQVARLRDIQSGRRGPPRKWSVRYRTAIPRVLLARWCANPKKGSNDRNLAYRAGMRLAPNVRNVYIGPYRFPQSSALRRRKHLAWWSATVEDSEGVTLTARIGARRSRPTRRPHWRFWYSRTIERYTVYNQNRRAYARTVSPEDDPCPEF